ncbi:DUF2946 domain-containing protein [Pseudomonas syringae]|nr:DUF2946 domain-containing protein [Pseudomonas syringae]MBD8803178.1 DUF2946 domain-containing protein [Pseudomonas syringae]MBD8813998.1 DUF2946 domain-containing protein [Pseudomonas syringae]
MKAAELRMAAGRLPGTWLACFAMLMVLVGPLIGQGSAMLHATQPHSMSLSMHEHPCMDMQAGQQHHKPVAVGHMLDACGYCSLLFNSPGIPQTFADLPKQPLIGSTFNPFSVRLAMRDAPVFPGAMSHAPPPESRH